MAKRTGATPKTKQVEAPEAPETITALPIVPIEQGQDIQTIIGSAIRQYGVTDTYIAQLRTEMKGLTIGGITDKDGYEVVRKAIGTVRDLRTSVEKKRNELNRNAIDYKNAVDTEAKRITALLVDIENPLKEQKEWVDTEKARLKAEEEQRKNQIFVERTTFLLQRGFAFLGSMYVNGDTHVTTNQIREYADQQWSEVVARAEEIHQAHIAAEKAKAEAKAKADEEQRKQMEEQQRLIEEQKRQLEQQKAENAQLLYENRTGWLLKNGYELKGNSWVKGGYALGEDSWVRTADKDWWQNSVKTHMAKITEEAAQAPAPVAQAPAPVAQAPVSAPTSQTPIPQPETPQNPTQSPVQDNSVDEQSFKVGFYQARTIILSLFNDGVQRTRAEWINIISKIEPF